MARKQKVFDPLAQARATPTKTKMIWLNPAAARNTGAGEFEPYPAFPTEILACRNLEHLEIFRGISWSGDNAIPKSIGTLTKLVHLGLGGLTMTVLPEDIGKLVKLEALELLYDEQLVSLPKSLGKLTRLKKLDCTYCQKLAELPTSIGDLKELRDLKLVNTALTSVPKEIWKLTKLESLWLPDDLATLPPGISALKSLRHLGISPGALASVATELPALKKLTELSIRGKGTSLPAELGQLAALEELSASYLGLESMPSLGTLGRLVRLRIGGNQLKSVVAIARELPALVELEYANNPVPLAERRILDKAMKQKPVKRVFAGVAASAPIAKPELIGKVASINASLTMVIADAAALASWGGAADDSDDWENAHDVTSARSYGIVKFKKHEALVLTLEMSAGIAEIYRTGETLTLVEKISDNEDDPLFVEWLVSPLKKPRTIGTVALPTKVLAINPTTDAGTKVKLKPGTHAEFGDDGSGIAIHVGHTRATFELEADVRSSWGEGRRCRISF